MYKHTYIFIYTFILSIYKLLIILTILQFMLITPFVIYGSYMKWDGEEDTELKTIMNFILFTTTLVKPILYALFNSKFRRGCRELFCFNNLRIYRSEMYVITTKSKFSKKNQVGVES